MNNPQELKELIIKQLIEKGEYDKVLAHIGSEEKDSGLTKLIKPMSAVADILTENAKGAFMEDLEKRLDEATTKGNEALRKDLEEAHNTLKTELEAALKTDRDVLSDEILSRVVQAQANLEQAQQRYADAIVTAKADEMFSQLAEQARLTETEIQDIVDEAAMSVESQLDGIIQTYIAETGITTDQISDFREAVTRLLPQVDFSTARINWSQIVGAPDTPGGTSAVLVQRMIDNALAGFSGGSGVPPGGTTGQALIKQSNADGDADWATLPGGGDMLTSVYDPAAKAEQVLTIGDSASFATSAQGALADTAVQPAGIANFETTTQLNTRDTNNRARANHTGTQAASTISDFQSTVSANTDVVANTAARHDAVTLDGAPNYLTIAGQVITRALIDLTSHITGKLPFANFADGSALSVTGRSANSVGEQASIAAGTDHTVLRRSGNSIGFGAINLGQANATTGSLPVNKGGTGRATSTTAYGIIAAGTTATGAHQTISPGTSGHILKSNGASALPSFSAGAPSDVGLGNVDNTSDANKPISTATQAALDTKVDYSLVSEASSATPTATGTALRNDYVATALVANATLAAPSGTANANGVIRYRITASGGTRTIGYNAALLAGTITRTTSLAAGETLTQVYQRVGSTWACQFESVTS